ncbi:MAG: CBS domain-containing protein [Myxococcales bacterium]|nr:CBS domain-containing protein [Myxococcales bacterium]MCB9576685.1 CBS domain-containing protein [Polyangiaceae bacterium]
MPNKPQLVSEIMTREVITLYEEDNLDKIEEGMNRYRFRHLPVVDDGKLVGLVTHRDLLRAAASALEPGGAQKTRLMNQNLFVRDVMQTELITVGPDEPLKAAGKLMMENKLGCLPVVDAEKNLVGIVTATDYLELALRLLD